MFYRWILRELTSAVHCFEVMVGFFFGNLDWDITHDPDQLFLPATLSEDGDTSQVRSSQRNGNLYSVCAKR